MIKTINHLCSIIGYDKNEVFEIIENIDHYYYEFSQIKYNSQSGLPKVKDGVTQRRFYNPSRKTLRDIQNKLQQKVLCKIELIPHVQGGVKGCGSIDNSKIHKGNIYRFQTDITNFFPSISDTMVFNSLRNKGFSKQVADAITKLTTFRTKDSWNTKSLPQGAPTSPTLSNIVFEKIDKLFLDILKGENITYSRWIDDLTFSSNADFREKCILIINCIADNGLKVSKPKTTYRKNKTVITGAIVGLSTMKVTEKFREKDESKMKPNQIQGRKAYKELIYRKDKEKPVLINHYKT
jgi:RNA-directed DNA polymerase